MSKVRIMEQMLKESSGYISLSKVEDEGISRTYFYDFVKSQGLNRVGAGLYHHPLDWEDPLYEISQLNSRAVFSHETALSLHDLMEREPWEITVTVPKNYNASHLRKMGVRVFHLPNELYELGITERMTVFGNIVRVYDRERAIIDLLRIKNRTDIQIFVAAFKSYFYSSGKYLHLLMRYADAFGVYDQMKVYTEVML